jgi:hypothetical protein
MIYQEPAEGILKTGDYGDAMFYHIACDCGNEDDAHDIMIEADEYSTIQVHITHTQHTKWWELSRWKQIWQIITKGHAEMQTTLVLNEQTAYNYSEALKRAIEDVKNFKEKQFKKD